MQFPAFNPPSATASGKPQVPPWNPPAVTKEKHNFAELTSIDLSKFESEDPKDRQQLVDDVKRAIREDGFLFIENYGITLEQASPLDATCRA